MYSFQDGKYHTLEQNSSFGFVQHITDYEKTGWRLITVTITKEGKWCAFMEFDEKDE